MLYPFYPIRSYHFTRFNHNFYQTTLKTPPIRSVIYPSKGIDHILRNILGTPNCLFNLVHIIHIGMLKKNV